MKTKFIFELTLDLDESQIDADDPRRFADAFKESAVEFADELKEWVNKHPFSVCCRYNVKDF